MSKMLMRAGLCSLLLGLPTLALAEDSSEVGPLQVTEVVGGLKYPWGLAFLPDGQGSLITERPGQLRWLNAENQLSQPLTGVPAVFAKSQGGLLDVALSPTFSTDRLVYLSYSEADAEGDKAGTAVGRGKLTADMRGLDNFQVIFRQQPKLSTGNHFGSRLVFDRDGYLFITLGETTSAPPRRSWTSCRASWCVSIPTGAFLMTTRSLARRARVARSGPTATAMFRGRAGPAQRCAVAARTRPAWRRRDQHPQGWR